MALLTPVGSLRIFIDGEPAPCELCEIKKDEDGREGRYRLVVSLEPDGKKHGIMCVLLAAVPVTREFEQGDDYITSAYTNAERTVRLSVGLAADREYKGGDDDGPDRVSAYDYDYLYHEENGFYYDLYQTLPITGVNTFTFGVDWLCGYTEETAKWTLEGADPLSADAPVSKVEMYDKDDAHTQDYGLDESDFLRRAADGGNSAAMVTLGNNALRGEGGVHNLEEAYNWYRKAAMAGNPIGIYSCALSLYLGQGVKKDLPKAFTLFKQVADSGQIPEADYFAGLYYQEGLGDVGTDYGKALWYYHRGAEAGIPNCIHQLGVLYSEGLGVDKDPKKALDCYLKAGGLGDAASYLAAGTLYESGDLGKPDFGKALEYFRMAGAMGAPEAKAACARVEMKSKIAKGKS